MCDDASIEARYNKLQKGIPWSDEESKTAYSCFHPKSKQNDKIAQDAQHYAMQRICAKKGYSYRPGLKDPMTGLIDAGQCVHNAITCAREATSFKGRKRDGTRPIYSDPNNLDGIQEVIVSQVDEEGTPIEWEKNPAYVNFGIEPPYGEWSAKQNKCMMVDYSFKMYAAKNGLKYTPDPDSGVGFAEITPDYCRGKGKDYSKCGRVHIFEKDVPIDPIFKTNICGENCDKCCTSRLSDKNADPTKNSPLDGKCTGACFTNATQLVVGYVAGNTVTTGIRKVIEGTAFKCVPPCSTDQYCQKENSKCVDKKYPGTYCRVDGDERCRQYPACSEINFEPCCDKDGNNLCRIGDHTSSKAKVSPWCWRDGKITGKVDDFICKEDPVKAQIDCRRCCKAEWFSDECTKITDPIDKRECESKVCRNAGKCLGLKCAYYDPDLGKGTGKSDPANYFLPQGTECSSARTKCGTGFDIYSYDIDSSAINDVGGTLEKPVLKKKPGDPATMISPLSCYGFPMKCNLPKKDIGEACTNKKIAQWTGIGLIAGGILLAPVTAGGSAVAGVAGGVGALSALGAKGEGCIDGLVCSGKSKCDIKKIAGQRCDFDDDQCLSGKCAGNACAYKDKDGNFKLPQGSECSSARNSCGTQKIYKEYTYKDDYDEYKDPSDPKKVTKVGAKTEALIETNLPVPKEVSLSCYGFPMKCNPDAKQIGENCTRSSGCLGGGDPGTSNHTEKGGLWCSTLSKCEPKKKMGQACHGNDKACRSGKCAGLYCADPSGRLMEGAPCITAANSCQSKLWCGGVPTKCRPLGKEGAQCLKNSHCDSENGFRCNTAKKCTLGASPGSLCAADNDCKKKCTNGKCSDSNKECSTDDDCKNECKGLRCSDSHGKLPEGVFCGFAAKSCADGLSCNGVPTICRKPGSEGSGCWAWSKCDESGCKTWKDNKELKDDKGNSIVSDPNKCLACSDGSKCIKKKQNGSWGGFRGSTCASGKSLAGVCTDTEGKLPKGALCGFYPNSCVLGYQCDGFKCQPLKQKGEDCFNPSKAQGDDFKCATKKCKWNWGKGKYECIPCSDDKCKEKVETYKKELMKKYLTSDFMLYNKLIGEIGS